MNRFLKSIIVLTTFAAIAIFIGRSLFPLPDISNRPTSAAIEADGTTILAARVAQAGSAHPDMSGVLALGSGHDALASRIALAASAEISIDTQYYIWHDDTSGILLLNALYQAAKRGVRVRLLVDDNGVPGLDNIMSALNAHQNFEIRLFNPSTIRSPKILGYVFDFFRMNRRMHNKSFIVDGAVAIIGGRNIGDEYFTIGDEFTFIDLDALAAGAIVSQTASVFDEYWNSESVFTVQSMITNTADISGFEQRVDQVRTEPEALAFLNGTTNSADDYTNGSRNLEWTEVKLVADDPEKGLGTATKDQLMITRLGDILGKIETKIDLVSAYFIPGEAGTQWLTKTAHAGNKVRILTNALNTTDVLMVHSGYARYRRELLEANIDLFELKLGGGALQSGLQTIPLKVNGASLHAKTFAVDDNRIFIGSFNFDPRSALLNCEMGFLISSPAMAQQLSNAFDGPIKNTSYQPMLTPENKLIWREKLPDADEVVYQEEPDASLIQQIILAIANILPIEWML